MASGRGGQRCGHGDLPAAWRSTTAPCSRSRSSTGTSRPSRSSRCSSTRVAPPFTPIGRVRALGRAIGAWAANLDQKVLFIASGGLSHDPPVPRMAKATPRAAGHADRRRPQPHPRGPGRPAAAGHRHRPRVRPRGGRHHGPGPGMGPRTHGHPGLRRPDPAGRLVPRLDGTRPPATPPTRSAPGSPPTPRSAPSATTPSATASTGPSRNTSPDSASPPPPSADPTSH